MNVHRYEKKQKKKKKDGKLPIINLCLPVSRGFYHFNLGILRFIFIKAGFWPRLSTVCASSLFIISPTLSSHTTSSAGYFAGENFLIILWSGERVEWKDCPDSYSRMESFDYPSPPLPLPFLGRITVTSLLLREKEREREESRNRVNGGW